MTTEQTQENNTTQPADAVKGTEITLEQALDKIKVLETNFQEAVSTRDKAKEKLRKLEQDLGDSVSLREQYDSLFSEKSQLLQKMEEVQAEYNNFKTSVQSEKVNAILQTAIEKAGAKSVGTVLKLIDKSKVEFDEQGQVSTDSIENLVKAVQESDPILFGAELIDPGVKRAGDTSSEGIFDKEIKACKTQQEVENVLRKYGKM